jgi:hypothetical protein
LAWISHAIGVDKFSTFDADNLDFRLFSVSPRLSGESALILVKIAATQKEAAGFAQELAARFLHARSAIRAVATCIAC